jgi:hypothetical protein
MQEHKRNLREEKGDGPLGRCAAPGVSASERHDCGLMMRRILGLGVVTNVSLSRFAESRRFPHEAEAEAEGMDAAMESVRQRGFAVVRRFLSTEELEAMRRTEAVRTMPTCSLEAPTRVWRLSSLGRFHRVDFCAADIEVLNGVEHRLTPFVENFFDQGLHGGRDDGDQPCVPRTTQRSDRQLLNAAPDSRNQTWHSDHRSCGMTIVLPLVDFTIENGGTQLLPGTHSPLSAWKRLLHGACVATAPAGSVLILDSRTYHRGLGNSTGKSRPAIVFRFDASDSPPAPGIGLLGSVFHSTLACLTHQMTELSGLWSRAWDR